MNIFSSTEYRLTEEDRLTNSLLTIFEHSEINLINGFLGVLNLFEHISDKYQFDTQIPYIEEGSRPDGKISTDNIVIIIENKRFNNLDKDQIKRHIDGIKNNETSDIRVLLCISNNRFMPVWLTSFAASEKEIQILFASWERIYQYIDSYEPVEEVTAFLIDQFGEYLAELGYSYYRNSTMNDIASVINDYKNFLPRIALFQKNHQNLLMKIAAIVNTRLNTPSKWKFTILDLECIEKWDLLSSITTRLSNGTTVNLEIYCDFTGRIALKSYAGIKNSYLGSKLKNSIHDTWHYNQIGNSNYEYSKDITQQLVQEILENGIDDQSIIIDDIVWLINTIQE